MVFFVFWVCVFVFVFVCVCVREREGEISSGGRYAVEGGMQWREDEGGKDKGWKERKGFVYNISFQRSVHALQMITFASS